jgi:hypothetical protein
MVCIMCMFCVVRNSFAYVVPAVQRHCAPKRCAPLFDAALCLISLRSHTHNRFSNIVYQLSITYTTHYRWQSCAALDPASLQFGGFFVVDFALAIQADAHVCLLSVVFARQQCLSNVLTIFVLLFFFTETIRQPEVPFALRMSVRRC